MNIAEKNRAERMVEAWAADAKVAVLATTNVNIDNIQEPQVVVRARAKIELEIAKLTSAGYDFTFGNRYGQPEGVVITRSPNHATVSRLRKDADLSALAIAAKAGTLITTIWDGAFTFEDLHKALA